MPLVRIEFDDKIIEKREIECLSLAVQDIVSEETRIKDVFVYANSALIKVQIAPIEVFIEMSADKIENVDDLIRRIKENLAGWKEKNHFSYPINLTLIPMVWKIEIGI
jgi:hypothetical protein